MNCYKIVIAYDGTAYYGWQRQPDKLGIEQMLEQRFRAVFKKDIELIGASRTDAGVHALGQIAIFFTDLEIPEHVLLYAWNNALPQDILIRSLVLVDATFHPRYHVLAKTYYYHIFTKPPLPFVARFGYYPELSYNRDIFKAVLELFKGTHDFRSLCTGADQEHTIRTIQHIGVVDIPRMQMMRVEIKAAGFLRYMIRRMVGAALTLAKPHRSPDELYRILEEKNPHQQLLTAPSHGLVLRRIRYKEEEHDNKII